MCLARRRSARRAAAGFSLVEAVAATAFLALTLMAFAANTISLTHNEKSADATSAAHALAQQKLELLRSSPLGAVAPGNYADPLNPIKADGTANGTFTRTWVVSANDTPTLGLHSVTVSVSWTDTRAHTTSVAAYIRCSRIPC
jgi:Tfp pilus assembly protein PilV